MEGVLPSSVSCVGLRRSVVCTAFQREKGAIKGNLSMHKRSRKVSSGSKVYHCIVQRSSMIAFTKETYMKKQLTPQHQLRTTNRARRNTRFFRLFVFVCVVVGVPRKQSYDVYTRKKKSRKETRVLCSILTVCTWIVLNVVYPPECWSLVGRNLSFKARDASNW